MNSTIDQAREVFELQGTEEQKAIITDTLENCDFPWLKLKPKLQADVGRSTIPVEWDDLSRYFKMARSAGHSHSPHDHPEGDSPNDDELLHFHVEDEDGNEAHAIANREAVLGLAWYSGKVTIHSGLTNDSALAAEVFLSEGAHMVDFFYMTDDHRIAVWNAVHPEEQHLEYGTRIEDSVDYGHGHGWFDIDEYRFWVGEEFMGLFVESFSTLAATLPFGHAWEEGAADYVRASLLGVVPPEEDDVEDPTQEPDAPGGDGSGSGGDTYFGVEGSNVFHRTHGLITKDIVFDSYEAAVEDGRRPCMICLPEESRTVGDVEEPEDAGDLHLADVTDEEVARSLEDLEEHLALVAQGVVDVWPDSETSRSAEVEHRGAARQGTKIISRAAWAARAPRNRSSIANGKGVVFHWAGGSKYGTFGHDRCYHLVRAIQNFHMNTRGWADVAYSGIVCPHGFVFECRGPNTRTAAQGTNPGNNDWHALMYLGSEGDEFTVDGQRGFLVGRKWLMDSGIGSSTEDHRTFTGTTCPGSDIRAWRAAGMKVGGGGSSEAPSSGGGGTTTAAPPTTSSNNTLRKGDKGAAVRQWQRQLRSWNPKALPRFGADGDFGNETVEWTGRFMVAAKLTNTRPANPIVGPRTRDAMKKALANRGPAFKFRYSGLLRQGSKGAGVREWQNALKRWHRSALPKFGADADFGAETANWTKRFQRAANIGVDGIVGPNTRSAMERALNN